MRTGLAIASLFVAVSLTSAHAATPDPLAGDPLDPIALARMAEEVGDARLGAELSRGTERARVLSAARASAYAAAPEALVAPLATLACGRDPVLAPEAAYVLGALPARFSGPDFDVREVLRADLRQAREALRCVERTPPPRADIAAQLALLAATLDALLR